MITHKNWTYTKYSTNNYSANISIGGEPGPNNEYIESFYVNKYIGEDIIFQMTFSSLEAALIEINRVCSHWNLIDLEKNESNSGCSSCQAH